MGWLEDKYSDACIPVFYSDTTKASAFILVSHKVTSILHGETLGQWTNGPSTLGAYKLQSMFIFSSILFIYLIFIWNGNFISTNIILDATDESVYMKEWMDMIKNPKPKLT